MGEQEALKKLAEIFALHKVTLYAVGGYVRSRLLGIDKEANDDIDLCSSAKFSDIQKWLSDTAFEVRDKSRGLGVVEINVGGYTFEHATFRKEYYQMPGEHTPIDVEFTDDINEDAKRRDFTVNAIYMNLLNGEYVDPFGGIADLRAKKIRAVVSPNFALSNDGIRLLRMIRFAVALGFDIDEETLAVARRNNFRLKMVSKSLIRREFDKILIADTFYPKLPRTRSAHYRGVRYIGELGLWKEILPVMAELQDSGIKTVRDPETVYEHSIYSIEFAQPRFRLAVLLHDIGMLDARVRQKQEKNVASVSGELIRKDTSLLALGYSREYIDWLAEVVSLTGYDMGRKMKRDDLRRFILAHRERLSDIINTKVPTEKAITYQIDKSNITCSIQEEFAYMQRNHIATSVKELDISGLDIINEFPYLEKKYVSELMKQLLEAVALRNYKNDKQALLMLAKKLVKKIG